MFYKIGRVLTVALLLTTVAACVAPVSYYNEEYYGERAGRRYRGPGYYSSYYEPVYRSDEVVYYYREPAYYHDSSGGVVGGTFHVVGEIIALPFRAVGALFGAIF